MTSTLTSATDPCICSSGPQCVCWKTRPPTESSCAKRTLPTRSAQSWPIQWQNVALTDSILPSTAVTISPQGAASSSESVGNSRIV